MEAKLTPEQAEEIQQARDLRQTRLMREFCRQVAALPDDFVMGSGLTEESLKGAFEPIANNLYQYMKDEGMMVGDIEYVKKHMEVAFGFTLSRVANFSGALISNAMLQKFGVSDVVMQMPMAELEKHGLVVVDPKDLEETEEPAS